MNSTQDYTHLMALQTRLSRERDYLAKEKSKSGREIRAVWISQIEKEITSEEKFLGIDPIDFEISDEDLLAELSD